MQELGRGPRFDHGRASIVADARLEQCTHLQVLPSIEKLVELKRLKLHNAIMLASLPETIGELEDLVELDASGCRSLVTLPESINNLRSLETLDLHCCTSLLSLPHSFFNGIAELKRLNLDDCESFQTLPKSVTMDNFHGLEDVQYRGCSALEKDPRISRLKSTVRRRSRGRTR